MKEKPDTCAACINKNTYIKKNGFFKRFVREKDYWILAIPGIIFYVVFNYIPILGNIIAFEKYNVYLGFIKSPWVGFKYFEEFLRSRDFFPVLRNTFLLGFYQLLWGFPVPIIFALFLNEVNNIKYKKLIQTVSYMPHFLSVVVVCSMLAMFLSPTYGIVNTVLKNVFGIKPIYFLGKPEWFRTLYIGSGIWQNFGFSSIIYLAALSGINPTLYEAADMDGCGRIKKMWHISIPGILPTVILLFIMNTGQIMRIGFEKVLLLYSPMTYDVADIISTLVYRSGLEEARYSYATAVGLFNSVISLFFVLASNYLSRRLTENSLW